MFKCYKKQVKQVLDREEELERMNAVDYARLNAFGFGINTINGQASSVSSNMSSYTNMDSMLSNSGQSQQIQWFANGFCQGDATAPTDTQNDFVFTS